MCPTKVWAMGSYLDPEVPKTGLRGGVGCRPRPLPSFQVKSQLESGRNGRDMTRDRNESIQDVMQEDQRPTE
jgi:hypothetical protein